jgi:DNA polymerase III subunit beta
MKLTTTAEALSHALKYSIQPDDRPTIPVLGYARILDTKLIATNLDWTSIIEFDGDCDEHLDFLVPFTILAKMLEGQVGTATLEFIDGSKNDSGSGPAPSYVKLKHDGCVAAFITMGADKFPSCGPEINDYPLTIDGDSFHTCIDRTLFCICREESRYAINNALLLINGGNLKMIATDGHRMSIADAPNSVSGKLSEVESLIHREALDWLRRNINGPVYFGVESELQCFKTGRATLIGQEPKNQFPNWSAVLPMDSKITAKVDIDPCAQLHSALHFVSQLADPRSMACRMLIKAGELTVFTKSDKGKSSASIGFETSGEIEIGVNAQYVSEFLERAGNNLAVFALQDPQAAMSFSLPNWQYILMPMRI